MTESLATSFVRALAGKDAEGVRAVLHPEVDFRAMTPDRFWDADAPDGVLDMLDEWFEATDVIEGIETLETDSFADRVHVGYRLRVRNPDGLNIVGQEAYLSEFDGRIGWLRIMCAGYRPIDS